MNEAVARAARRRDAIATATRSGDAAAFDPGAERPPQWRPFQLAFILLNLAGLVDEAHSTARSSTCSSFQQAAARPRRISASRHSRSPSPALGSGRAGAGVAVIMRYTLRLLTLDQLARAAGVVCALELMRNDANVMSDGRRLLGDWPIEIGLWVGSDASPNRLGGRARYRETTAVGRVRRYRSGRASGRRRRSKIAHGAEPRLRRHRFTCIPNEQRRAIWTSAAPTRLRFQRATVLCRS